MSCDFSIYYVYYEQYLTMVPETLIQLGICLIPTFIFNFVLLGFDLYSGFITTFTILMIVVDTAAICSLWGVDLNAVSLINLVAVRQIYEHQCSLFCCFVKFSAFNDFSGEILFVV